VIRVVVFDFDGTLVDSNAIKHRCFDEVVAHLPGGVDALAMARSVGGDRYRIFQSVASRLSPGNNPNDTAALGRRLAADYTCRCLQAIAAAPERRGAYAALHTLRRRGMKVWVNSSTPRRDIPALLRARGLLPLIEGALGAPRSKLQNLRAILAAERANPCQALVVGDGADDEAAARRAGTWFVAVTAERRIKRRVALAMPDLVRLPAVILRLETGKARRP
jgi:beta-phosphoglucomutase-like phosphatase (HAD superfamily)